MQRILKLVCCEKFSREEEIQKDAPYFFEGVFSLKTTKTFGAIFKNVLTLLFMCPANL